MSISNYSITTLAAVRTYLKIDDGDTARDGLLEALIDSVSEAAEKYTGRIFVKRTVVEETHYCHGDTLQLGHYPVLSVTELEQGGDVLPAADYTLDNDTGIIESAVRLDGLVSATYQAGIADTPADCPKDLQLAVWQWIAAMTQNPSGAVSAEKLGDYSVSYFRDEDNIPACARKTFDRYKTIAV